MKFPGILTALLALCLLLAGCNTYKEPPEINTRPPEDGTSETTASTTESLGSTESTVDWESLLTYAEYLEMSAQERSNFADSFESFDEFLQWLNTTKAIYDEQRKENEMNQGGTIDMGDIDP